MPYATFDEITMLDKSDDPVYVYITESRYLELLHGMLDGFQVWINNGVPSLRVPPPIGEDPNNYEYIVDGDFWKRLPPADYDGSNYVYNATTNRWDRVPDEEQGEGE